ncbi:MAG TPA: peptidylprolyl isomerase, partial [Polyangiaceae bacterium]|nr:peptidylprolyl isomerase [Polyangiaceae bacterium]
LACYSAQPGRQGTCHMMNLFRKGGLFTQIFMGAVVLAIIAAFVLGGQFGNTSGSERCAVKFKGACVDLKEFNASYGLAVRASGLELTGEGAREVKGMILNGFAERLLLSEEAKRLGISISEEDLDAQLMEGRARLSLPAEHEAQLAAQLRLCIPEGPACAAGTVGTRLLPVKDSGSFNPDLYRRVVRNYAGRGTKQFKEMQHAEYVAARMRDLVRSRARVSEQEAFLLWERERSQAVVRTVQARGDWMARYVLNLSNSDVDEWAMNNKEAVDSALAREKDDFKAECPSASEIFVRFAPDATDDEKTAKRTEIEEAERRLKAGEDFAMLARELSDSDTAQLGGALGCLGEHYGPGAQELLQATGKLKLEGVSPVVETVRGFHLLQYHGPLVASQVETTARQYVARKLATTAKAKELAEQFAKDLIVRAKTADSLKTATDELVKSYLARGPLVRKDTLPGEGDDNRPKVEISAPFNILQNPIRNAVQGDVASLAFNLKPEQVHDKAIGTYDGAAVLQLKSKEPAKREEFEKDKVKLIRQLSQVKAGELLENYLGALRKQAGETLTFDKALVDSTQQKAEGEAEDDEES